MKQPTRSQSAPQGKAPPGTAGSGATVAPVAGRRGGGAPPSAGSTRQPPPTSGPAGARRAGGAAGGGQRGRANEEALYQEIQARDDEIRSLRRQLEAERSVLAQRTEQLLEPEARPPEVLRELVGAHFPTGVPPTAGTAAPLTSAHMVAGGRLPATTPQPPLLAQQPPPLQTSGYPGGGYQSHGIPAAVGGGGHEEGGAASIPQPGGGYGAGSDPFLSASKACVRADGPRCGRLEAAKMLSILARYHCAVPPDMAAAAHKKGMVSYTIFVDRLRELQGGA